MNKVSRLGVVLSIVWMAVIYPTIYIWGIKTSHEDANVLVIYCESAKSMYPNDLDYMSRCRKERDEIYENSVADIHTQTAILTVLPLPIFWLIAFMIRKSIAWIKKGD